MLQNMIQVMDLVFYTSDIQFYLARDTDGGNFSPCHCQFLRGFSYTLDMITHFKTIIIIIRTVAIFIGCNCMSAARECEISLFDISAQMY